MEETKQDKNRFKWFRIFRVLIRIFLTTSVLLLILILLLNIPAVQTFIAGKFIKSLQEKTGTQISLESVKIALPHTVNITDLYLQDKHADTLLYLHSLSADVNIFSLIKNEVSVKSLTLENVVAHVHRKDSTNKFNYQFLVDLFAPDTTVKSDRAEKPRKPWKINVNDVKLKNIHASFIDVVAGINLRVNLGDFNATLKDIDLGKEKINVNEIFLKNTSVALMLSPPTGNILKQESSIVNNDKKTTNIFLGINIQADRLNIENTNFSLDNISSVIHTEGVDYQHLHITKLNAAVRNITINSEGYWADFQNMSLTENSGFSLKKLTAIAKLTNHQAELKNLQLETAGSKISGDLSLAYSDFNAFIDNLWKSDAEINLGPSVVKADELFLFAPFLATDKYAGRLKHSEARITAQATGKLNDLEIDNLELSLLEKTILKSKGRLTGLPDVKKLDFDVVIDLLTSTLSDVNRFINPVAYSGLKMPQSFTLKGTAKGKINSVNADLKFNSSYGNLTTVAFYQNPGPGCRDTFAIDFSAQNVLAGTILADTMIGKTSFSGKASGSGINIDDLSGSGFLDIHQVEFNSYVYNNILVDGHGDRNVFTGSASSTDTNFTFKLIANADLHEAEKKFRTHLDLTRVNLHALNLLDKNISLATTLTTELNYSGINNFKSTLKFANSTLKSDTKTIPIKTLDINAFSHPDSLRVKVQSDLADGAISSNISPDNLHKVMLSAWHKYFGISDTIQVQPGKHLAFNMNMHVPQNIINELVPELDTLRISKLEGVYNSDNNELSAEIQIPEAIYSDAHLDSLSVVLKGKNKNLSMDLQLGEFTYNNMRIENFIALEQIENGKLLSEISILDSIGKPRYRFANEIETKDDIFRISFLPDGLTLDGARWTVKEGNLLEKQAATISAHNFLFSNERQSLGFSTDGTNRKLTFTDFGLQNLLDIVELQSNQKLIKGDLAGEVEFPLSQNGALINANLEIDSLYILDSLAGNLAINIKTLNDKMNIDTYLVNDENKLSLIGDIDHLSEKPVLNLDVLVDINDLQWLEPYSFGALSKLNGKINAEVSLRGTTAKPDINGTIGFKQTSFNVKSLNLLAKLDDEKIDLDNNGIHFDDFVIGDEHERKLTIKGDVLTNNFSDFGFDLHLLTKQFQPMNSTSNDNHLFYGKLSLATDVWLKGDLKSPGIEAYIKIDSATNLTYALPGSELKLITSEGVVHFLAPGQQHDSVYVANEESSLADSIMSHISGIDLAVNLEIDPNAKFTVDVDPKSGDYLTLGGSANLKINQDRSGKQSITGVYEVKSGLYQLSFYNLVKKTFTIEPGSTVAWSGNPKDADLNISANHTVTTPSTSLMATESTTMSETEKNMFKQRLPYDVKLNILGFLTQPKISFNITLPDKYLAANPMVATKLTQLNSEDRIDDLNKQVFALLVTGSFIADNPTSTGSSPSSVASTAARNSVNGILAGQMNNVSSKFIHGVDVNFGLTTFDDGTGGSNDPTTELDVQVSKKLFNERVTIEAQSSFDLSGNKNTTTTTSDHNASEFAVTYNLTQDGEYKMKAFSQTAYDLFDGDIITSGIAVLFTKEFNSLRREKKTGTTIEKKEKE